MGGSISPSGRFAVLPIKGERIALQHRGAPAVLHLEFVVRPLRHAGDENLPDAAVHQLAHRVNAPVPAIEIADDTDALRIGRPDVKGRPLDAANIAHVRAEMFVEFLIWAVSAERVHADEDTICADIAFPTIAAGGFDGDA